MPSLPETTTPPTKNFLRSYPYWLPPVVLSIGLNLYFLNLFIGDWDGLEYTVYSLRGAPSPMALGRSLFRLFNHSLYVLGPAVFSVPPEKAYLVFQSVVVV